jgi:hypothetical protein
MSPRWYDQVAAGEHLMRRRCAPRRSCCARTSSTRRANGWRRRAAILPDDPRLVVAEAQLLRDAGRHAEAFAFLARALESQPDSPRYSTRRRWRRRSSAMWNCWSATCGALIALKPDSAQAYNALGYSFADRNIRLEEAAQLIDKACRWRRTIPSSSTARAGCCFARARPSRRWRPAKGFCAEARRRNRRPYRRSAVGARPARGGHCRLARGEQGASGQRGSGRDDQAIPALRFPMRFWLACLAAMFLAACAGYPNDPMADNPSALPCRASLRKAGLRCVRVSAATICGSAGSTRRERCLVAHVPTRSGPCRADARCAGARLVQPQQPVIAADSLANWRRRFSPAPAAGRRGRLAARRKTGTGGRSRWLARGDHRKFAVPPAGSRRLLRVMEAGRGDVEFKLIVDDWDATE